MSTPVVVKGGEQLSDYDYSKTRDCTEMLKAVKKQCKRMREEEAKAAEQPVAPKKVKNASIISLDPTVTPCKWGIQHLAGEHNDEKCMGKPTEVKKVKRVAAKDMRKKAKDKKNPLEQLESAAPAPKDDAENEELKQEWLKPFLPEREDEVYVYDYPVAKCACVCHNYTPCWCDCNYHNSSISELHFADAFPAEPISPFFIDLTNGFCS